MCFRLEKPEMLQGYEHCSKKAKDKKQIISRFLITQVQSGFLSIILWLKWGKKIGLTNIEYIAWIYDLEKPR